MRLCPREVFAASTSLLLSLCWSGCSNDTFVGSPADSGPETGASPGDDGGAPAVKIACGSATCTAPDACCLLPGHPLGCLAAATCSAQSGNVYTCDDPSDCVSGQVCCVIRAADKQVTNTQCVATTACDGSDERQIACAPGTATCPPNRAACAPGDFLEPFIPSTCQP